MHYAIHNNYADYMDIIDVSFVEYFQLSQFTRVGLHNLDRMSSHVEC